MRRKLRWIIIICWFGQGLIQYYPLIPSTILVLLQKNSSQKEDFLQQNFNTRMACRSVSWPPLHTLSEKRSNFAPLSLPHKKISTRSPNCGFKLASNRESHHHSARNCLNNGKSDFSQQDQPQDALLRAISGVYFPISLFLNLYIRGFHCVLMLPK